MARRWLPWLAGAALAIPPGCGGSRVDDGALPGEIREEVVRIPMVDRGTAITLEGTVFSRDVDQRLPLVVINHGTPRNAADRANPRSRYYEQSKWFVEHGMVVLVPMRRGYAGSGGVYSEGYGTCEAPAYAFAGMATADDIGAAIDFMRSDRRIDPRRIVVAGLSAGGWGSLVFASLNPQDAHAVINFAGGRGSPGPGVVCSENVLFDTMRIYGAYMRAPSLWLYSENDMYFSPQVSNRMFEAFRQGGSAATMVRLPAFGADGHRVFPDVTGMPLWTPHVQTFLNAHVFLKSALELSDNVANR